MVSVGAVGGCMVPLKSLLLEPLTVQERDCVHSFLPLFCLTPASSGEYDKFYPTEGHFVCAACETPLYSAQAKFNRWGVLEPASD